MKRAKKSPPAWTVARLAALLGRLKRDVPVETLQTRYGVTLKDLFWLNKYHLGTVEETGADLPILFRNRAVYSPAGLPMGRASCVSKAELHLALTALRWLVAPAALRSEILALANRLQKASPGLSEAKWETFFGPYLTARQVETLLRAMEALREGRKLCFLYEGDGKGVQRTVRPLNLRKDACEWRLLSWDEGRDALRVFKLVQMSGLRVSGEAFDWPPGVDRGEALARDLSVYRPSGKEVEVRLRLRPNALKGLRHLFPHLSIPATGNAWVRTRLLSAGPAWVARTLLPFVGEAEVLSPPEFKKAFEDERRTVMEKYE